jgi:solute:Na+ symporter, SSS family
VLVTFILRARKVSNGIDQTVGSDYHADDGDPKLKAIATH